MTGEEKSSEQPKTSTVDFKVYENTESQTDGSTTQKRKLSKRKSIRASFLRLKGLSFRRSGGERGADIETLRGTHGPDFEGYATINRKGGGGISCGCFGGGDENDEKIILVKGAYCFVFGKESDPAPKYAVACAHMKAVTQSPSHGVHPVTIESALGDVDWELGFEKKELAEEFVDVFRKKAAEGEADEVRKRLGHDNLLQKRSSVKYAESVGEKKLEDQPEKKENVLLEDVNKVDPMMAAC
mmetsp:Transcript_21516/g.59772  ORF Transcript_21516/g.59772 Transcript_21516/m.59772 type:complete len:242 (+) Transcript_21516:117-842(+)|eukprot:CAMPEP_0172377308 /NCGR_PEP_ID=MMETSP1060-20121228/68836_1 /TAXON_ID=37318 /ORGANISM="Pseudo-nitzschia pungens, Strain cf. cingulata" /LENGTH=241 /DNA_ID=CAMNT_0013104989 /DNA_START=84 /DNA_END=809 /DNA_ORIENTATION=-